MKNNIKLVALFVLLCLSKSSAQVTTSITDVFVNSQTYVNNCSTIDFGTISNNSLTFYYKLTKPTAQAIGNSALKVLLKYDNSSYGAERANIVILSGSWSNSNTEYIGTITCNISESEIQASGSSIFIEFISDTGIKTHSCEYPLKKTQTPTFTLTPSTVSIPCGSTTPVTFTVNNVYNSPGTLSYNWNVGSGWSGSGNANSSSITLTPTSYPYSSISVTPILNGVSQPTKTATVSLAPFTSAAGISGAGAVCTSASYTLNGLLAGESVVWSVSDTSVATISGASGNTVTVNKIGNGVVTLTAMITNSCNQIVPKNKTINMGAPSFPSTSMTGESYPLTGQYMIYSVPAATGVTSYNWYFDVGGVLSTNINGWEINGGQGTTSINAKVGNPGSAVVVCKASNSCNNVIKYTYVNVRSQTDPCSEFRIVITNPIKSDGSINGLVQPPPIDPCDELYQQLLKKDEKNEIKLYDFFGRLVYTDYFYSDAFEINNLNLKKGNYILNITLPNGNAKREILVVE